MLLKIERKVLRKTVKSSECSISLSEIGNYNGEDVYQAFLSLKEKGYFTIVSSSINREMFTFALSSKGRFYKDIYFSHFEKYTHTVCCSFNNCNCHIPLRKSSR